MRIIENDTYENFTWTRMISDDYTLNVAVGYNETDDVYTYHEGDEVTLTMEPAEAAYFEFDEIGDCVVEDLFEITITAYDEYDNVATGYGGTANPGTLYPDNNESDPFTERTWTGQVNITETGENVHIMAEDQDVTGTSNEFDVKQYDLYFYEVPGSMIAGEEVIYTVNRSDAGGDVTDGEMVVHLSEADGMGMMIAGIILIIILILAIIGYMMLGGEEEEEEGL